jgi:hypothetical protein
MKKKRRRISPTSSPAITHDIAQATGEKSHLFLHVRDAFADIRPHNPPLMPFIYWDPDVTHSCAQKIISRSPVLQVMAATYDKSNDMAKKWAQEVRTLSNNERSTQIRVYKAMWLNEESPLSLTQYTKGKPPLAELSNAALQSGLTTIEELRALIHSSSMFANPVVYDFFCAGLESGNLKQTEAMPPSTISDLITPSHEAHARAELWWASPYYEFRHAIGKRHARERIAKWREFLPLVLEDRANNEKAAHTARLSRLADGPSEADNEPQAVTADNAAEKYW